MTAIDGIAGAAFWLGFAAVCVGTWVAMRRHDRRQELDVYRVVTDPMDDDRIVGAPW